MTTWIDGSSTTRLASDLERRLSTRTYNVTAAPYNATGNGVTDDTTAVQAAITAAATGGGRVLFPGGTYLVGPLTIPDGTILQGINGMSYLSPPSAPVSTLKLKAASANALLRPDDSVTVSTGVQINDLTLDTNNVAQSAINIPDVGSSNARMWLIERCTMINSGFSAAAHGSHVYIGNLNTGVAMRDCSLLSNAAGVTTQHSHGWDGVGWYGSDGIMENCFIGCYADAGFVVYGGSADITLNVIGGGSFWNDFGVLVGGQGAVFTGMSIDHNYVDGAYLSYGACFIGCTFHTNSVQTNNTFSHIDVANPVVAVVHGCRVAINDAGVANLAAYFITNVAGADVHESGNYLVAGASLGTGWRIGTLPSIASAATITLLRNVPLQLVTGTTTITSITAGPTCQVVTLRFAGILTLTDGSNLKLAGNFVTTADDTITLVSDGTNWNEIARSVN